MNGAIVYTTPGPLAQLHMMRDCAMAQGNWRMAWAITIVIGEDIGADDESIRVDIDRYYRAIKAQPREAL